MNNAIYVMGASTEIDMVEKYIAELKKIGWRITHDWCAQVRRSGQANFGLSEHERRLHAHNDAVGIRMADVCWLLFPQKESIGCWVEFGIAWATPKMTIVSGPNQERTIFTLLSTRQFPNHNDALQALTEMRK